MFTVAGEHDTATDVMVETGCEEVGCDVGAGEPAAAEPPHPLSRAEHTQASNVISKRIAARLIFVTAKDRYQVRLIFSWSELSRVCKPKIGNSIRPATD
jgi:hypothetical protein